jgi:hypothetical protein
MKIKYAIGLCLIFCVPLYSQAVIIDGKFTGTVQYQDDMSTWNQTYNPYWKSNIVGTAIFGTFWYDTELAPANSSNLINQSIHETVGNSAQEWLGIKIFIAGTLVDVSHSFPLDLDILHREEAVVIEDFTRPVNWDDTDYFAIAYVSSASNSAGDYDYKWVTLRIEEPEIDFVNGVGLQQEFNWVNTGDRERVSLGLFNVKGSRNGEMFDASASLKLSTLNTSIRKSVPVPEPLPLGLLGLGLFVLVLRRLKLIETIRLRNY